MEIKNSYWITPSRDLGDVAPAFRRSFTIGREILSAELQVTALGVYTAELNGRRIGDFVLAPGWTSYKHRLQVQHYEVTDLIKKDNELLITVDKIAQ